MLRNAFKIVPVKGEAKRPRGRHERKREKNVKMCFNEGCLTRGRDSLCSSGSSHERREICCLYVVLLPYK